MYIWQMNARNVLRYFVFLTGFLWTCSVLFAQKRVIPQDLIWYGYFNTLEFSERWQLTSEIQERHYVSPARQHQFLLRSQLTRKLDGGWGVSAGFCYFLQSPNDPLSKNRLMVPELRPHLELSLNNSARKVYFDHRYRFEARFFHNTNITRTTLEDGYDFGNFRFRYRLTATFPILKYGENLAFKLKVSDEIHLNIGSQIVGNVFDQNRFYVGANADIIPGLSVELGYLNWFQQKPDGDFFHRDIIRFTIYHKVRLFKGKDA